MPVNKVIYQNLIDIGIFICFLILCLSILKGQWLRKAGFESGEYVEVQVDGDKITLTKTEAPEKAEKASLEEKVKNLDKKQREKMSKLIDEL